MDSKRIAAVYDASTSLQWKVVQQQIELVSSGAIMAGINVTKLSIYLYILHLELQQQFVSFVAQTDKSKLFGEMRYI